MTSSAKSYVYAGCTILMWSTVATAFKLTLPYTGVLQLLLLSSITAALALGIIVAVSGWDWKEWTTGDVFKSAYIGLLNPFLYYIVLFNAYDMLPAQQAQTLNYLWPIMLVLFSVFFLGQRVTFRTMAALGISFVGVLLIATEGRLSTLQFRNPVGVGLALFSTVIWAGYWILNLRERADKLHRLFLNFVFGSVYIVLYLAISGNANDLVTLHGTRGLLGSVYVGLFEMGITFFTWIKALEYAENTAKVSNLIYLAPFLSLIFIALVLGERVLPATIGGLLLIVTGIVIQQYRTKTTNKLNEHHNGAIEA